MSAIDSEWRPQPPAAMPAEETPVRPLLARWAAAAGVLANLWLVATFFLNWSWQAQLGSVAPVGIVWFAGWWRWQRRLDGYELAALGHRIRTESEGERRYGAALAHASAPHGASAEDWRFEMRYQQRRCAERRAEAEAALEQILSEPRGGWRRRHARH